MNIFEFLVDVLFGHKHKKHQPKETLRVADSTQPLTQLTMKALIKKIRQTIHGLMHDLEKFEQGNKTAGQRARKASLELEKLLKEFRKRSVHEMPE